MELSVQGPREAETRAGECSAAGAAEGAAEPRPIFGVVKPERSAGTYFFDMRTLLAAKVVLYLKESLGTRTSVLSKLMDASTASQEELRTQNPNYVVFNCRLTADEEPIKLGVPCRALEAEVENE